MMSDRYPLAISDAVKTLHLRGRHPHLAEPARAMLARVRALDRWRSVPGVATMMHGRFRAASDNGRGEGVAANRAGLLVPAAAGAAAAARRLSGVGVAGSHAVAGPQGWARVIPAAVVAAPGAILPGRRPVPLAKPRLTPVGLAKSRQLMVVQHSVGGLAIGSVIAGRTVAQGGRGLAAFAAGRQTKLSRPAVLSPGTSGRLGGHMTTLPSQRADGPGFHRTVKQARARGAAGDVYLDKNLVGYHLAAAITAEQTRAAARPNISGAGFNSSMAALRPSGAGS